MKQKSLWRKRKWSRKRRGERIQLVQVVLEVPLVQVAKVHQIRIQVTVIPVAVAAVPVLLAAAVAVIRVMILGKCQSRKKNDST